MINLLKKVTKEVNKHLWMIEMFWFNKANIEMEDTHEEIILKSLARTYLMKREAEEATKCIERIKKYCLSEINGTFYNDFEKKYEGSDIEPNYNQDTPYQYILGALEKEPSPEIGFETKIFFEQYPSIGTKLLGGLVNFIPEAGPYKQNEVGEMVKVSVTECEMDDNLKAGSMLSAIEEYNLRISKIKAIAKNHGNIGAILILIGNN